MTPTDFIAKEILARCRDRGIAQEYAVRHADMARIRYAENRYNDITSLIQSSVDAAKQTADDAEESLRMSMPFADNMEGRAQRRIMEHLYLWAPLNIEALAYDLDMTDIDVRDCVYFMTAKKWLDGNNRDGYDLSNRFEWMDGLAPRQQSWS